MKTCPDGEHDFVPLVERRLGESPETEWVVKQCSVCGIVADSEPMHGKIIHLMSEESWKRKASR